jgi:hypothetical protein
VNVHNIEKVVLRKQLEEEEKDKIEDKKQFSKVPLVKLSEDKKLYRKQTLHDNYRKDLNLLQGKNL